MKQHFSGKGAKWLRDNAPLRLIEVLAGDREKEVTLEYMKKFGYESVRGGPWTQVRSMGKPKELDLFQMATSQISETKIASWMVQPAQKNSHNALYWPITVHKDSKAHPRVQIGGDNITLRTPFGATQYDTGSRYTLDLSVAPWQKDILEFIEQVDTFVVDYVWANVAEIFPKKCPSTRAQLEDWYCPLLSQKENFDPLFRTKVNQSTPIFLMDKGKCRGSVNDITSGSEVAIVVSFSKIWTMGANRFGVTANTEAVMAYPSAEKGLCDYFVTSCGTEIDTTEYPPGSFVTSTA